jgi:hypothetical protein
MRGQRVHVWWMGIGALWAATSSAVEYPNPMQPGLWLRSEKVETTTSPPRKMAWNETHCLTQAIIDTSFSAGAPGPRGKCTAKVTQQSSDGYTLDLTCGNPPTTAHDVVTMTATTRREDNTSRGSDGKISLTSTADYKRIGDCNKAVAAPLAKARQPTSPAR